MSPTTPAGGHDPKVVVVIGGTSGIGLATAVQHARRGDHVVVASRSRDALDAAGEQCRSAGANSVRSAVVDVTDRVAVEELIHTVHEQHGRIDAVVLAAAVMAYGSVEQVPAAVFERVVMTDVFGTAHVARAVLPIFRSQDYGVLIVVNSLLGSVTVPLMGAYAVAKWGQLALARTLQQETRRDPGVHVCVVSPGSVNTPIYYQAASVLGLSARPPWPVRQPEDVARKIADLVDRPRDHVSMRVGLTNPLIVAGFRLLPQVYDRIVGPLFRRIALTGEATEDTDGNVHQPVAGRERVRGRWPEPVR